MLGELQKLKLTKLFQLRDSNQNGSIGKDDFDQDFETIIRDNHLQPGSPEYETLRSNFEDQWNNLREQMDTNGDGLVSLNEWLDYHDLVLSDNRYDEVFQKQHEGVFDSDDADGDGKLDVNLFLNKRKTPDMDDQDITKLQLLVDPDGDGYMEKSHLLQLVREFYLSNDPEAPGNWFFGNPDK